MLLVIMCFVAMGRNKRKERRLAELGDVYSPLANQEFMDKTDNEYVKLSVGGELVCD
jgi:hypothetical protein